MVPVSVLLPVCNGEGTLQGALESLLRQTLPDFEIVAVDDGSTDGSKAILESWARRDGRLRVSYRDHAGLVGALRAGLRLCRGRYIARMDADDVSRPERLELQVRHLEDRPDVGVVASRVAFGGSRRHAAGYAAYVDWTNGLLSHEEIALNRFVESPLAHPSVMFRAELVKRLGAYREGPFPEDYELWLRWMEAGVRFEKLPQELLIWNDSSGRLSRRDVRYSTDAFYRIKSFYLAAWLRRGNRHHPEIGIVGAGRVSRRRAALLEGAGLKVTAYVDIDPDKVGKTIRGRPVLHREELPPPGGLFLISYVASRGARGDIRQFLESRGYRMGRDFLLAA